MSVLILFVDGVGLGRRDQGTNPFMSASMPVLSQLIDGGWWADSPSCSTALSSFVPLDAQMNIKGTPQSATGQASILTGVNIPKRLGEHYGPKPNIELQAILRGGTLVSKLARAGRKLALLNAYPEAYIQALKNGVRTPSSIQQAFTDAEVTLFNEKDLIASRAISLDFTGDMWHGHTYASRAAKVMWRASLKMETVPLLSPYEAGQRLTELCRQYDLAFFDHWLSDYIGHRGDLALAIQWVEILDSVVEGLMSSWNLDDDTFIIISDHGNIEDSGTSGHTLNPVPCLVVGKNHNDILSKEQDLTALVPFVSSLIAS